jgi:hypothetical protein
MKKNGQRILEDHHFGHVVNALEKWLIQGQKIKILNYSELARDASVSVDTARRYLEYLRLTYSAVSHCVRGLPADWKGMLR